MAKAFSVRKIYDSKFELLQWGEAWAKAFGYPEATGVIFVWGNSSNNKTSFLLQMANELSKNYKVFYDSLEEGNRHTMQQMLLSVGVDPANRNFIIGQESPEELDARLTKRKGPRVCFIDSIQYTNLRFEAYRALVQKHPTVLFIINSQAEGKEPAGRVAKRIKFDAMQKIFVEGGVAISNGRYMPGGRFTIWKTLETKYHGTETKPEA